MQFSHKNHMLLLYLHVLSNGPHEIWYSKQFAPLDSKRLFFCKEKRVLGRQPGEFLHNTSVLHIPTCPMTAHVEKILNRWTRPVIRTGLTWYLKTLFMKKESKPATIVQKCPIRPGESNYQHCFIPHVNDGDIRPGLCLQRASARPSPGVFQPVIFFWKKKNDSWSDSTFHHNFIKQKFRYQNSSRPWQNQRHDETLTWYFFVQPSHQKQKQIKPIKWTQILFEKSIVTAVHNYTQKRLFANLSQNWSTWSRRSVAKKRWSVGWFWKCLRKPVSTATLAVYVIHWHHLRIKFASALISSFAAQSKSGLTRLEARALKILRRQLKPTGPDSVR